MRNDDEDPKPVYRRCLTTFLDILGFKQLIRTQSPEFVHRLLDDLKRHATPKDFDKSELDAESLNFSDCVVRSIHVESEHNLTSPQGILWYELFGLAWIQGCVIHAGQTHTKVLECQGLAPGSRRSSQHIGGASQCCARHFAA